MGQLAPFPTSKGVWGIAVSSPSGVRSRAPAAQRFACSLRSPGSLFCYIIKGKQLHKSFNLAAGGLRQPPWRARITWARGGGLTAVARGIQPSPNSHPDIHVRQCSGLPALNCILRWSAPTQFLLLRTYSRARCVLADISILLKSDRRMCLNRD